ncbi:MAG: hypothetical protein WC875_02340 [Candidatus Absconditabacterales bacterium]
MGNSSITSEQFANKFILTDEEKKEGNLVLFSGSGEIGFSIKKDYEQDILFKPSKTKTGEDDSVALIGISYEYKSENNGLVPIYISISKQSKYLMRGHYDYNFSDPSSPTKESLEISNRSTLPAEFESYGYYFYNINENCFIENGEKIEPRKIIDDLYQKHIKTAHKFSGIPFRSKMRLKNIIVNSSRVLILFLKRILKKGFGRDLQRKGSDDFLSSFDFEAYKKEDLLPTSPNKISILGFETNITKQSFLTLCFIIILLYALNIYWWNVRFIRAKELFSSQIFLGALIILSVSSFDSKVPILFFWMINGLIKIKNKFMFMKIKV